MNKNRYFTATLYLAACIAVCSCVTTGSGAVSFSLDEAIERSAAEITQELPTGTRVSIVAFSSENEKLSNYIMDELAGVLVGGSLVVADRRNLPLVYQELGFQMSGDVSDKTALEIGNFQGVEYVITGQFMKIGTRYRYRISGINVETAALEISSRLDVRNDRFLQSLLADNEGRKMEKQRLAEQKLAEQKLAELQRKAEQQQKKAQAKANVNRGIDWFLRGNDGERFTSIGANVGAGYGNKEAIGINFFGNINATLPLVWNLFAEGGVDIGFFGAIADAEFGFPDQYSMDRTYARLNMGIPDGNNLWYIGVGFSHTRASYEYESEYQYKDPYTNYYNRIPMTESETFEYSGTDLVFGGYTSDGWHVGLNLANIFDKDYFEVQIILGYSYRF
jgi:hypothetical protein